MVILFPVVSMVHGPWSIFDLIWSLTGTPSDGVPIRVLPYQVRYIGSGAETVPPISNHFGRESHPVHASLRFSDRPRIDFQSFVPTHPSTMPLLTIIRPRIPLPYLLPSNPNYLPWEEDPPKAAGGVAPSCDTIGPSPFKLADPFPAHLIGWVKYNLHVAGQGPLGESAEFHLRYLVSVPGILRWFFESETCTVHAIIDNPAEVDMNEEPCPSPHYEPKKHSTRPAPGTNKDG